MSRAEQLFNQGLEHYRNRQLIKARDCLKESHELAPNNPQVSDLLAFILRLLGDLSLSRKHFENAIRNSKGEPKPELLLRYSSLMLDLGDTEGTKKNAKNIIEKLPNSAEAWSLLGECYFRELQMAKAVDCFERADKLITSNHALLKKLSTCYHSLCLWKKAVEVDNRLIEVTKAEMAADRISPLDVHTAFMFVTDGTFMREIAENLSTQYQRLQQEIGLALKKSDRSRNSKKIKLGYFSTHLSRHATAYLVQDLFGHHDYSQFDVIVYASNPDQDCPFYNKIKKQAKCIKEFNTESDLEVAQAIHDDQLDVLIDMDGVVGKARRGIFSLRPAPIQITWKGTPATSGAKWFDYVLLDDVVAPMELEAHYTEEVLRVPDCYFFNSSASMEVAQTDKADYNLPDDKFIFASFNLNRKIDEDSFMAWCKIMNTVEDSVLWMLIDDNETRKNLANVMEINDVDPQRLIPTKRVGADEHVSRLKYADLMLDSFVCGAHTTCVEALWMELPVLAKIGDTFHARVAASMLTAAKMEDCITRTTEEYINRAVEIATNDEELARLKSHLKENKETLPLFDQKKWVLNFEKVLADVVERSRS